MEANIFYAHSNSENKSTWQTIISHLSGTANLALKLGQGTGVEQYAYIAALLHDIGKYSLAFQNRLTGSSQKVDHSTAGAVEIERIFGQDPLHKAIAEMLAYCISGHHSGLMDHGSPIDVESDGTLQGRLKKPLKDYSNYVNDISIKDLSFPTKLPISPTTRYGGFSLSFFTRMIYSILVDADFQDTETFMNGGKKPRGEFASLDELRAKLELQLNSFGPPHTQINIKRAETLMECIQRAKDKPGLFTLTVPTGGGKTLSSLAFALYHAQVNQLDRVIYIIPYTTIIEQNAAVFKRYLGEQNVLEHHSNFDWETALRHIEVDSADDLTNQAAYKLRLSAENWDVPVIVTTNVQFFESLFANRSSRCRKIHNLAKSVLIFDEAQMLPREFLDPCMKAVYELIENYGTSAVFCTATQPSLTRFFPANTHFSEISKNPTGLYESYRRVQVLSEGILEDSEVIDRLNKNEQVLCIVNTRAHAKGLFDQIENVNRFHLSTWMCPVHRKMTVEKIRSHLQNGKTCRVVSTQLMEAGIDLDFPVGYRALAGLDSIIQAAGRVNREGKRAIGTLYVFESDTALIKRTPKEITQAAAVAKMVLERFPEDPICLDAIRAYYDSLYDLQGQSAFDANRIMDCFEKGIPGNIDFDFEKAAKKFKLIKENTVSLIVPFDSQADDILSNCELIEKPYLLLRKLQPYTINLYEKGFNTLQGKGAITFLNEEIPVLSDMAFYNSETGIEIPEDSSAEGIII